MNKSPYQKLPGRGMTWGGPSRVWLGADHVLLVLTRGYVEVYRRFFFSDVQAFVVQPTSVGKIWNGIWGGLAGVFILPALAVDDVARIVLFCLGAPFLIGLLINLALGRTCAFYVRTAVQTERLPALSRLRAAEKFIARVEPLVQAAQGEWTEQTAFDLALLQSGQLTLMSGSSAPPVLGS